MKPGASAGFSVPGHLEALVRAWEARDPGEWQDDATRYAAFAKQALALGSPGLAFDMCSNGLLQFPADGEVRYLSALALANGGSSGRAARVLGDLLGSNPGGKLHVEALSLAGRVAKDQWARLPEGAERVAAGAQARSCYQRAFEASRDPFPGINAATMNLLTGRATEGRRIAREVRDFCTSRTGKSEAIDLWDCATLGEACLLLGDLAAAMDWYRQAAATAGRRHGDIASVRRQVKLLSPHLDGAAAALAIMAVPRVAVFTGHMIDALGRTQSRFPNQIEPAVATAIDRLIAEIGIGFGYCSGACGADIVFAERMFAKGAEVNIVLPFSREDFVQTSVAFAGKGWVERFDRVLARAASVSYCVEESHLGDDVLFAYAAQLTAGLAVLRSEQLETDVLMLAVAESEDERRTGGTLSNVTRWKAMGRQAVLVNLRDIRNTVPRAVQLRETLPPQSATQKPGADGLFWGRRQIRTMLFADMVGFSKLREHETPQFFVHFLGAIEREIDAGETRPIFGNTWGDGLYLVFEDVVPGADFALRLRDAIARIEWAKAGLPADMDIRIGMHTGPVFRAIDPIIKRENFFGAHVTRTARIEPVAAPGTVYVSEQLAAALAASDDRRFACDYLGILALSKQFGSSKMYRLRRASEAE